MAKLLPIESCTDCYYCKEKQYSHRLDLFCGLLDKELKIDIISNNNHTHFINLKTSTLKIKIPKECPLVEGKEEFLSV